MIEVKKINVDVDLLYNVGVDLGFFSWEGELVGILCGFFVELMGYGFKIEICYIRKLVML